MHPVAKALVAVALAVGLAGCTLPRGAAQQSEVLAVDDDPAALPFAVEPVTGATVTRIASWPVPGERALPWIGREPRARQQIIAAGDRMSVTVWTTEENSLLTSATQRFAQLRAATVAPDGTLFLPYLGAVTVAGLTPQAAREQIEAMYGDVIPSAQVQVELESGRANTVSLVGGVARPGDYPMPDRDYTLMALLAAGGGVSPTLKNPQLRLHRGSTVYGIAAKRLFGDPRLDTTLQGGDKVVLIEDGRYFLSLGAARNQSQHPFTQEHVSALDALSIIGGVEDSRANLKGLLILRDYPASAVRTDGRGPPGTRVVFTLDLTGADGLFSARQFRIAPGDLVYATQSPVTSVRTVVQILGSLFGLANQFN
jgi:polysaccharide export outer membrane protein